jgi:hypothetical protein
MDEIEEIVQTIEVLQNQLDDLLVRGLRAVEPAAQARLRGMRDEFRLIGAEHMASRLEQLGDALENDDAAAARALLEAQTSLRLFERVLSLRVAGATLEQLAAGDAETSTENGADQEGQP